MQPLTFDPLIKRIRWGGRRLGTVLGKPIGAATDAAESWELSDYQDDQSLVATGPYAGWTLNRLVRETGADLLGVHADCEQFPLLIKFLDANDRLSVQVHPNDEQARLFAPRANGKTESWVILDAEPDSRLYVGLKPDVDRSILERSLAAGTVEKCLHTYTVSAGDCILVPAGTVHAVGEGILLAEIQQSSDLTFRLYDWGRLGPDGELRELHITQALECTDFERGPVGPVVPRLISTGPHRLEELVRTRYFVIRRHTARESFSVAPENRFRAILTLRGCAETRAGEEASSLEPGQTLLVPASSPPLEVCPDDEIVLLETFLPDVDTNHESEMPGERRAGE